MKLLILAALIGLTGFTPHHENHENWTYLGFDSENNAELFADLSNMISDAGEKGVWFKFEHHEEQALDDGMHYHVFKGFYLANCNEQTFKVLNGKFYDADEKYVSGFDVDKSEIEPQVPSDDFGFAIYQTVCGQ